jgi:hypothetical protein
MAATDRRTSHHREHEMKRTHRPTADELLIALWKELGQDPTSNTRLRDDWTITLANGPRLLLCAWNGQFFEVIVRPVLPIDPDVMAIADSIRAIDAGDIE